MCIVQLLSEHTLAGGLENSLRKNLLSLNPASAEAHSAYVIVLVLSIGVFMMELRRILGCPKRFFYEKDMDRCSYWTVLHFVHPVLILSSYCLVLVAESRDGNALLQLTADGFMKDVTINLLYEHGLLAGANMALRMIVLGLQNILLWRYVLAFFPQLSYTTDMVAKLCAPLATVLCFIASAFLVFGTFIYAIFSTKFFEVSSLSVSVTTVLKVMLGSGTQNWKQMYANSPTMWTFLMCLTFLVNVLFLKHLPLAVMLSHKKEKDLRANASAHAFWSYPTKTKQPHGELVVGDMARVRNGGYDPWKIGKVVSREGGISDGKLKVRLSGWCQRPREWLEIAPLDPEVNPAKLGWAPKVLLDGPKDAFFSTRT